ncbi:MAG: hypothetical protein HYS13_22065 [Planctomycetia bacterium]|nr:hypothetical protein [Planctomycetia bacterium]
MPSTSLQNWIGARRVALDELESAHQSVGGTGRGRRFATEQINHAYAVLLSSQFQGFCRDLHSECAALIAQAAGSPTLRDIVQAALVENRRLDRGNPTPGNIGIDFKRFGVTLWDEVKNLDVRNASRQDRLEELNLWRNAIAHQDFSHPAIQAAALRLQHVRVWRRACDYLAQAFDEAMRLHLRPIVGASPW